MYTKGEWKLAQPASGAIEVLGYTGMVATLRLNSLMKPAEVEANAHLIAAAPELYEALKRAVNLLELAEKSPHKVKWGTRYDCLTPPETIGELKQPIAKVEGGK